MTALKEHFFTVRVYGSHTHPEQARVYGAAHRAVLDAYGVGGLKGQGGVVGEGPRSLLFMAEDAEGNAVAGMRLQPQQVGFQLPMLEALAEPGCAALDAQVAEWAEEGLAEACGWWVAAGYRKLFLPAALLRGGVYAAYALGIRHVIGFPSQHSVGVTESFGFSPLTCITGGPTRPYPDVRYEATAVHLRVAYPLKELPLSHRYPILKLAERPVQHFTEQTALGRVGYSYVLDNLPAIGLLRPKHGGGVQTGD